MFVIKYRKIFFIVTMILTVFSFFALFYFGLNFGIDFRGGSILEVSYESRPSIEAVKENLNKLELGDYSIRPSGEKNFILRTKAILPDKKTAVNGALSIGNSLPKEERFNTIGPVVGKELQNKALVAIGVVILGIVLFITFAFRKVSEPVSSWKYGMATIIALAHDVLVPTGIFIVFSKFHGGEIDMLFVTALLAILGYSVHDTIVVFDRVRENLRINRETRKKEEFETTVGRSVAQTFGRSINTSLTIFLVLVALYFIGGESTRNFAFVLLVGVIAGTYSSIFLASPLLVTLEKLQKK
ncbi:MAG: protein translocase subunit SecF [bacterium]|nr:protein translocase subunit SecF [bacterium]